MNESNSLSDGLPLRLTKFLASKYTIAALALAVLMYLMSAHPAFAQSATYTPPANLNSFPAVSVPSWLDTGSNSWMMTAGTFVGLQSIPGLSLYYGGLTRKKFSINTALMCFYGFSIVLVVWVLAGYNFGFGPASVTMGKYGILGTFSSVAPGLTEGSQAVGRPRRARSQHTDLDGRLVPVRLRRDHPLLFVGAIIERTNFKAWIIFVPLWSLLVYSPMAYALFAGGWLNQTGQRVDFSGGYVIHLNAGIAALRVGDSDRPQGAQVQGHQAQQPLLGVRRLRPRMARLERVQRRRPLRL